MTKHRRIPKPVDERLRDCEAHVDLLSDALRRYPEEPHRFKQIAAELRVLVCESRTNRPLLLNLMDELGFSYEVKPPGPPFEKQPIPLVGWKDDPEHQQLSEDVALAIEAGDEAARSRTLDRQAALRRPLPLREYVNQALAVFIAPYDYSYRDLALAVAQQMGSSHEDESVDEPLVHMGRMLIAASPGYIAPLIPFGQLVVAAGVDFSCFARQEFSYEATLFNRASPSA